MKFAGKSLLGTLAVFGAALVAAPAVSIAQQSAEHVSSLLKMPAGCYAVSYDKATEQIGTICKGQPNWDPEALQWFNGLYRGQYLNRFGQGRTLKQDLEEKVGPGPFMAFYLSEMDRLNLARPK